MSARISDVQKGSPAGRKGIRAGETLLAVNGREVFDVLDYRFFIVDTALALEIEDEKGARRTVTIEKGEYDDPGLCFATYLMDRKHSCRNRCVFCFIDQLPKGLRESLYFKDDDERLSFLMGNYITLTNLGEREARRIIDMHISPVNISVHTTNPELRARMMGNRHAGEALSLLRRFAQAGTAMNCQLVLCPGYNDGDELDRSLRDLGALYPAVQSVAAVPVGLTKYREGLAPLDPFSSEGARDVIARIDRFGEAFRAKHGTRLAYPADEFFLKAGGPIPPPEYYEGFAQLENGVGMLALFEEQFEDALAALETPLCRKNRCVSVATGVAAGPSVNRLCARAQAALPGLSCRVYPIENDFFGHGVTVSGLVTGGDLMAQLAGRELGDELLFASNMLRSEGDLFLDGRTKEDVENALGVRAVAVENDGGAFLAALMGEKNEQ